MFSFCSGLQWCSKKLSKATYSSDLQTDAKENENLGSRKTKRCVLPCKSMCFTLQLKFNLNNLVISVYYLIGLVALNHQIQKIINKKWRSMDNNKPENLHKGSRKKIAPPSLPSFPTPQSLPIPIKTTKTKVTSSSTTSLFDKIPSSSSKVGNDYVPISNFVYIHVQVYTIN